VAIGDRPPLTLSVLVSALAYDAALAPSARLRAAARPGTEPAQAADALIEYLADQRIVLVLDDYHLVTDEGVTMLVRKLERSEIQAVVVLVSRRQPAEIESLPLVAARQVAGLPRAAARQYLRDRGVVLPDALADQVWEKAGHGIPEALRYLAGLKHGRSLADTLDLLPAYTEDLAGWISLLFDDLAPAEQELAKVIAVVREPAGLDLLRQIAPGSIDLHRTLKGLLERFVVDEVATGAIMHDLFADYLLDRVSTAEREAIGARIAQHYQHKARELLLGVGEEPSYGRLYLESFPEYVHNVAAHVTLVDDLMARLADQALAPPAGARVLVLGSGNGIHDPGLVRHELRIVNLDIQEDIAALGRESASMRPARIDYVVADMTKPLPFAAGSMDAVFDIGSSFGYEETDDDNAAVFAHAARVLKPGCPFVFEYVNGAYWQALRTQRELDVETLPTGAVRTTYAVFDSVARTSLTTISLQRPDGSTGWFHHFMHYYTVDEILAMMRTHGLTPVAVHGTRAGRVPAEPVDPQHSPGIVVLALKKPR
jgi:SAM-dependent methyltransferase